MILEFGNCLMTAKINDSNNKKSHNVYIGLFWAMLQN